MAVNLVDFAYSAFDSFAEKVYNLVKCWRVGIKSCISETDLMVLSMYLKFLTTDLTDYGFTTDQVMTIVNEVVKILKLNNIVIDGSGTIIYVTNNTPIIVYNTTIVNQIPSYFTVYAIVGAGDVTINHGLNKPNPTVIVTDTSTGSRIRVEVGVTEITTNQLKLSFSSSSSGDVTVM